MLHLQKKVMDVEFIDDKGKKDKFVRIFGIIISLAILVILFAKFSFVVWYVIIAAVLSFVGSPMVSFFKKRKLFKNTFFPDWLAASLSLVIILVCCLLILVIFVPLIVRQANVISNIDVKSIWQSLDNPIAQLTVFLRNIGFLDYNTSLTQLAEEKLLSLLNPSTVTSTVFGVVDSLGNFFIAFFSIIFITFFFLKDDSLFNKIIMLFVSDSRGRKVSVAIGNVKKFLSRYFIGLIAEVTGVFVLESIGLTLIGVKGALPIALMGAFFNIIPYVGPIIGTSLAVILDITTRLSIGAFDQLIMHEILLIAVFVVSNWIDNFFLQPYIFSKSTQAHPLEIFIVILIFGSFGGVLGMILAIPGYTVLKVLAKEFFSNYEIISKWTRGMKIE